MSRIVLFDEELHEALTVVDIDASLMRAVEQGFHPRHIRLPIWPELTPVDIVDPPEFVEIKHVVVRLEPVARGRNPRPIFWYGYPNDPVLALQLRAAFLPGQIGEVQRREKEAYWRGVFAGAAL